ncbi:protein of unknown function DUF1501 [Catenulispora acidiphila DSM 44928]|uniref:DUF1501 domain-containing protein n=1 Tax=Catenulispora acidiphila (strain DSM 44928 / JCM 14897 / NBRC 102108 / NRRL B-24433 / ID139908) TaxID=479433 RepID=C7QD00_CATAD|nr:DUF1501 domain-containing protein [Catenulispora acidiphila]ACU70710.1 protein of unknown function DUF1501 [Catenulispora acidiphila DSM 44928]
MDTVTRRRFLELSGVMSTGAFAAACSSSHGHPVGAPALTPSGPQTSGAQLGAAAQHAPLAAGQGVLVLVTLYGGNDGLNTVIPYADKAYAASRPDLAYSASQVLDLGDGLGFNPAMTGLHQMWQRKLCAVVRGVGYPQPNHSHFVSMDIWQTATPGEPANSGWLGRWLDAQPDDQIRALKAISVGGTLPPLLGGTKTAGSSLPIGQFHLPKAGPLDTGFQGLGKQSAQDSAVTAYAARDVADLFTVAKTFTPALASAANSAGSTAGSTTANSKSAAKAAAKPAKAGKGSALAQQLDIVAECINASVPTRVYSVSLGGFDTHSAEKGTQSDLWGEVDKAVVDFQNAIASGPHGKNVVTMLYTEFGRRVHANANEGTDHGTAGPVLLLGEPVNGGFYGEQPSLTDLDDGDLKFGTDFRSVYATLLDKVLGADPAQILGADQPRIAFL